ncbi:MAG: magnesium transporter [Elusimicrobiota bacterium]
MKMKNAAVFIPEIKDAFNRGKLEEIPAVLEHIPSADLSRIWNHFKKEERKELFGMLGFERKVELFEKLSLDCKKTFLETQPTGELKKILNEMSPDVRADMFSRFSESVAEKFFSLMEKDEVDDVKELLEYPPETAGGKMTTEFVKLRPGMSAREGLVRLQESLTSQEVKNIYALFCVDGIGRVTGAVSLQKMLTAPPNKKVSELMRPVDNIKLRADMDQEEVARIFSHYDLLSAPVVDFAGRLIGVVTVDDIVDVIQQEAEEDIAIMSGLDPAEFRRTGLVRALKTRLPWLFLAWLGGIAAAGVIGRYEVALEQVVALAAFIPVIMHMGGTIGVQSSTVVVRGFALGEFESGRMVKILKKEFATGFILSAAYALLLGLLSYFRYGALAEMSNIWIATGGGIGLVMLIGAVTGVFLPFVFRRFGIDPAVATGPIITTLIDVAGLSVYFALAAYLLL